MKLEKVSAAIDRETLAEIDRRVDAFPGMDRSTLIRGLLREALDKDPLTEDQARLADSIARTKARFAALARTGGGTAARRRREERIEAGKAMPGQRHRAATFWDGPCGDRTHGLGIKNPQSPNASDVPEHQVVSAGGVR